MAEQLQYECTQCVAVIGERHDSDCGIGKCRQTGVQYIQCYGELHEFNGKEYGEHDGLCEPTRWGGEYPGVAECREYNLYTEPDSFWGVTEDLNTLFGYGTWDKETERMTITSEEIARVRSL